jgi:hypothetical protein
MGMGASIVLIALGAILAFAVDLPTRGLDLSAIGVILMLLGIIGVIADLVVFGDRRGSGRRTTTVIESEPDVVVSRGSAVVEESYVDDRIDDRRAIAPEVRRRVVRRREII